MATIFRHKGAWDIKWRDSSGKWQRERTKCATKSEAKLLAAELEGNAQRERLGLVVAPSLTSETLESLVEWWWQDYGRHLRDRLARGFIDRHMLPTLGKLPLRLVTPPAIEGLLHAKEQELAPRSLNYLRAMIHRVFSQATRRGRWNGVNPASLVRRRKETKRLPTYLRFEEVAVLLQNLLPQWRPLFAAAVYTGMRKGELIGLRKEDVDLKDGTIQVCRSYGHDTTKGRHADLLPLADSLRPYLVEAMNTSPTSLVFPRSDGKMHEPSLTLENILRRALAKAGLVDGYILKCRRKGCGHQEPCAAADQRDCPDCRYRMWPSPVHRKVRFHDLRHTTATLLLKEGVPLATVQRVLRHTDPRITAGVYGHLDVDDMRKAVNKLPVSPLLQDALDVETGLPPGFGGQVVDTSETAQKEAATPLEIPSEIAALIASGREDLNLRLPAPKSPKGGYHTVTRVDKAMQGVDSACDSGGVVCVPVTPNVPARTPFGGPLVDKSEGLLKVGDVARILRVCPATVYKLIKGGSLPHIRAGNAVRVLPGDVARYLVLVGGDRRAG